MAYIVTDCPALWRYKAAYNYLRVQELLTKKRYIFFINGIAPMVSKIKCKLV